MTDFTETVPFEIRASLRISGFDCDPDEISRHLDLQPSSVTRKSRALLPFRDPSRRILDNVWEFSTGIDLPDPTPQRVDIASLLRPLRSALESRAARLATIPPCSRHISVEVAPRRAPPEFSFAADALDFLNGLGLPVDIDIQSAAPNEPA